MFDAAIFVPCVHGGTSGMAAMRILGTYGSNFGQAQAVLTRFGSRLEQRGHIVTIIRGNEVPAGLAVDHFDAVIVAASVITGHYQRYIRDFVIAH
ncbi:MAG: flavodoxin domain-containing protein, partial [Vicinamibacterales bacterium]